ncbi:MAG TPA: hypothetical protein VG890_05425 [Puia sp.]|nr:hypothetical protein [Puia sp.]
MPNNPAKKASLVLFYLFLGFSALFALAWTAFSRKPVDFGVLLAGNLILFLVSFYAVRLGVKALRHKNVQVFLRLVYGSLFLKLIVLAIAAAIYIIRLRADVNKAALFGCFGLYLIYTFTEVRLVMQWGKQKDA